MEVKRAAFLFTNITSQVLKHSTLKIECIQLDSGIWWRNRQIDNIFTKSCFCFLSKCLYHCVSVYPRNCAMEIERDNWRALLVNGAAETSGVHSAAHQMIIYLLWAMKFYCLQITKRRISVRCVRAVLAGFKVYLT